MEDLLQRRLVVTSELHTTTDGGNAARSACQWHSGKVGDQIKGNMTLYAFQFFFRFTPTDLGLSWKYDVNKENSTGFFHPFRTFPLSKSVRKLNYQISIHVLIVDNLG